MISEVKTIIMLGSAKKWYYQEFTEGKERTFRLYGNDGYFVGEFQDYDFMVKHISADYQQELTENVVRFGNPITGFSVINQSGVEFKVGVFRYMNRKYFTVCADNKPIEAIEI